MLADAAGGGQQAARESATLCAEKDKPESPGCPLTRLCERSEAIHLSPRGDVDCFASLAMTEPNDGKKQVARMSAAICGTAPKTRMSLRSSGLRLLARHSQKQFRTRTPLDVFQIATGRGCLVQLSLAPSQPFLLRSASRPRVRRLPMRQRACSTPNRRDNAHRSLVPQAPTEKI